MIADMMAIQASLNDYAYPQWRTDPPNYPLAILSECSELADSVGWKWWKKQEPVDIGQTHLEIVDIWHFLMSQLIATGRSKDLFSIPDLLDKTPSPRTGEDTKNELLDATMTLCSLANLQFAERESENTLGGLLGMFCFMLDASRLSFEELHRLYINKAVLNLFRWQNGYGDGTYVKDWLGSEDNAYLQEITKDRTFSDASELRRALSLRYDFVLNNQPKD